MAEHLQDFSLNIRYICFGNTVKPLLETLSEFRTIRVCPKLCFYIEINIGSKTKSELRPSFCCHVGSLNCEVLLYCHCNARNNTRVCALKI